MDYERDNTAQYDSSHAERSGLRAPSLCRTRYSHTLNDPHPQRDRVLPSTGRDQDWTQGPHRATNRGGRPGKRVRGAETNPTIRDREQQAPKSEEKRSKTKRNTGVNKDRLSRSRATGCTDYYY